jgi:hypothetical protein
MAYESIVTLRRHTLADSFSFVTQEGGVYKFKVQCLELVRKRVGLLTRVKGRFHNGRANAQLN